MKIFKVTILLLSIFITACNSKNKHIASKHKSPNLLIDTSDNEGFGGDVNLGIKKREVSDTSVLYTLDAFYKNKVVGFIIEVPKITNKSDNGFGSRIIIKSLGRESDDFRNALGEIYKLKIDTNLKFINKNKVAYVDLIQFSKNVEPNAKENPLYYKMLKLFLTLEDGQEAELFFNIDRQQQIIELKEKDKEYRKTLLTILTNNPK